MVRQRTSDVIDELRPILGLSAEATTWAGATWVGELDEEDLNGDRLPLVGGATYRRARLLIWSHGQPRGFIEVPVADGCVDVEGIRYEIASLPDVVTRSETAYFPPISVVVCTRDRPDNLAEALKGLICLDYPHFELLIVDNNPTSGLTPPVVDAIDTPIRLVEAHGQGLAIARNVAVRNANADVIAFTDDDVVVDSQWLKNLARGFALDDRVACVCGMVPSAELDTPAQSYFDRRVGWARNCEPQLFDLAYPPKHDRLFPFRVAQFGTGANFAVRRQVLINLGGFDEGMGIGSPSGGGEDIDIFVRVLLEGHQLVREPSAVVWHRHRRSADELELQIHNYGLGLGAWIAKLASQPRTFWMAIRRLRPAVKHLRGITVVDQSDTVANDPRLVALDRRELNGVLAGPMALIRGRLAGRKAYPLKAQSSKLLTALDFRRGQMWGEPGSTVLAARLTLVSVLLGLVGAMGSVRSMPTFLLVIVVGAFTLGGPGSLALSWYPRLPTAVLVALVPGVSLAVCLIVVTGLLMLGFYNPVSVLLGLTGATVVGGLLRWVYLARRRAVAPA
jgi:GT2 family glycosyltransferase